MLREHLPPKASVPTLAQGHFLVALLRVVIGWHFVYEGWAKLTDPGWTSSGYLKSAAGPLAGFFHGLGSNVTRAAFVDSLNIWGLILIGLALMLGLLVRPAALTGIALLSLYYLAYPPLFAPITNGVSEGNYLIINKDLVELFALAVIAAFPATSFGLDGLLARRTRTASQAEAPAADLAATAEKPALAFPGAGSRRHVLASLLGVPLLGGLVLALLKKHGWKSFEEVQLRARPHPRDVFTAGASVKPLQFGSVSELKGRLPRAQIGKVTLSRMILGGNLMTGSAHARDLIYVSQMVKAYHHRGKIFETFALAETCSINTVLTNQVLGSVISDYWRRGGKIQFISDCGSKDMLEGIQKSIDYGACACYFHGGIADQLVEEEKLDLIAKGLELIRKNGLPAGIGGHKLQTVKACVERGLRPDFWMKTLHHVNY